MLAHTLAGAEPPPQSRSPLRATPSPDVGPSGLRMMRTHSQAIAPLESSPGRPSLTISDEGPPRELCLRRELAADPRSLSPGRPIGKQRPGLDRVPVRSNPPDLDPTDQIRRYRFGLDLFLKRPPVSSLSARGPVGSKEFTDRPCFYRFSP